MPSLPQQMCLMSPLSTPDLAVPVIGAALEATLHGLALPGTDGVTWLSAQPPLALVDVDARLRSYWVKPSEIGLPGSEALQALPSALREAALFVICASADGRTRQAGLRLLDRWPARLTLSIALVRCNDWVTEVRDEAQEAVMLLLERCMVTDIVAAWPLATRLRDAGRVDSTWLEGSLEAWVSRPSQRPVLELLLRHQDVRTRVAAHAMAFNQHLDWTDSVRARALLDADPNVARLGMQHLLDHASIEDIHVHCRRALSSPSGQVRSRALRTLAECQVDGLEAIVEAAVFDRAAGVRRLAAWLMERLGTTRAVQLWRQELDAPSGRRWRQALEGLADHAQPEDAVRLQTWLRDVGLRHRRNCIRGWIRAAGGVSMPILQATLIEDDRFIQHIVTLGQQNWMAALNPATLSMLWRMELSTEAQMRLQQRLCRALPLWRHLALLLDYMPRHAAERDWHARLVDSWLAASGRYSPLMPKLRTSLLERLQKGPHILSTQVAERLAEVVVRG